jgi:hypothetical protein
VLGWRGGRGKVGEGWHKWNDHVAHNTSTQHECKVQESKRVTWSCKRATWTWHSPHINLIKFVDLLTLSDLLELSVKKDNKHVTRTRHTQGEIPKKPAKKYISIQGGRGLKLRKPSILVVNSVSSCLSFFLRAPPLLLHIFSLLHIYSHLILSQC